MAGLFSRLVNLARGRLARPDEDAALEGLLAQEALRAELEGPLPRVVPPVREPAPAPAPVARDADGFVKKTL